MGVSAETLAGLQDNPALLSGLGAIDPDLARLIARHARFEIITDTTPHALTETAAGIAETGSAATTAPTTATIPTLATVGPTATAAGAETGCAAPTAATTPTVATATPVAATPVVAAHIATTSHTAPSAATAGSAETGSAATTVTAAAAITGSAAIPATTTTGPTATTTTHTTIARRATPPCTEPTTSRPAAPRQVHNPNAATELRYRPGARTARQARAIDGICRAPGCYIPAAASDLDHQDRFDHTNPQAGGRTTEDNLGARCRRHHRLKTLADNHANGWEVRHHPGRVVEWRTPTGESVTTEPEGSLYLFPTIAVPPVTAAGVPDAEPTGSIFDPGVAVNIMTELMQVYTTPLQRREQARALASRRARINMYSAARGQVTRGEDYLRDCAATGLRRGGMYQAVWLRRLPYRTFADATWET
ncbi:HNH endonuclease signature motif containing protein [Nocardia sp. NPDC059240]|uniref:HNH endonuclease signature motif containing protein n=1 Tax=Nocardia sp. NPDC059240 TaxID=3346786 RepID=UPI0036A9F764